jgi:2-polyprenyl-3-methyl-5-hydroxy-6-metoxy-1,4-benzoquinol methylase
MRLRKNSIITGRESLEHLYELKSFPVFIGCTSRPIEEDIHADMTWMICKESGIIQLKNLLPLDLVYSAYHSEAIGPTWDKHHRLLAKFIGKYQNGDVLEIGGADGALAKIYTSEKYSVTQWTIVEPNPSFAGNDKITVIPKFFDENTSVQNTGTVVHSHVLEHLHDPNVLLGHINSILPNNGMTIFSIPNLFKYLESKYSNAINFEHTYFLTEDYTDYLLQAHGFSVEEKLLFGDHSIFYAARKTAPNGRQVLINHYDKNKRLYLEMIDFYDSEVQRFNLLISRFTGKIFLFGAHIFSQFLLTRGLNEKKISGIIDNSNLKKNKRLYGFSLLVSNPDIISENKNVAVILKVGQYQEEVKEQLNTINSDVVIWE